MEKQLIYFLIAFFPHEFGYSERSYLTYSRSEAYQDEVILGALHCGTGLKSAVIFFFLPAEQVIHNRLWPLKQWLQL